MSAGKLPEGWASASVSTVTTLIRGVTYKREQAINYLKDDYLPLIRANNIQNGKFDTTDLVFVPENLVKESQKISSEDIVIAMSSGSKSVVGKSAHQLLPFECSFGAFCGALRPDKRIFPKFIAHFTISSFYRNKISSLSAGANINNIKPSSFDLINIPIPSFFEQKIIAEKIDTLLVQVDSINARLEKISKILKSFRQAVLGAAVSGKLTEHWRNEQGINLSDWGNTTFEEICTEITVGYVGKMIDRYKSEGVPFLRSQNIREFKFSNKNLLYVSDDFHKEIFKSRLSPGDLAIVRSGAPGTTCVIPDSLPIANCSDLVIARPSDKLNSYFGCIFMNSNVAKINVSANRVGIAQQHFNVGSMKKMPIHLPPLLEQNEIVRRVEQLFAYADTIEKQVNNALARVNNLTQSILARAFRGELTAQWRAENPELISGENSAAALLEKIKAERAASTGKKASRKKT